MTLTPEQFLDILLSNREVLRLSSNICPHLTNDLVLFYKVGTPRNRLVAHTQGLIEKLRGYESEFRKELGDIVFASPPEFYRVFDLFESDASEFWSSIFPPQSYPLLHRSGSKTEVCLLLR